MLRGGFLCMLSLNLMRPPPDRTDFKTESYILRIGEVHKFMYLHTHSLPCSKPPEGESSEALIYLVQYHYGNIRTSIMYRHSICACQLLFWGPSVPNCLCFDLLSYYLVNYFIKSGAYLLKRIYWEKN